MIWDPATLDACLAIPQHRIPGQRMGDAASNAGDRGDLIAHWCSVLKP